jgi:hypothetical protein
MSILLTETNARRRFVQVVWRKLVVLVLDVDEVEPAGVAFERLDAGDHAAAIADVAEEQGLASAAMLAQGDVEQRGDNEGPAAAGGLTAAAAP